jgi:hypothetical protein
MATPSIAIIPSIFKPGALGSVLPLNGDADLDSTRASSATRVNKDGLIETVATGVPRLDYSDGGCPSLLLETQSTNLVINSNPKNMTRNSLSSGVSVLGFLSNGLDAITVTANNQREFYENPINLVSGSTYTLSVYIDEVSNVSISAPFLYFTSSGPSGAGAVDLDELVVGQRFTRTFIAGSTGGNIRIGVGTSSNASGTVKFGGIQVELQSYATSIIKTTGAIATRLADTASKTGLGSYINSTEGVLHAKISANTNNLTFRYISLSDGTNNNCVRFGYRPDSNVIYAETRVGGVTQFFNSFTSTDIKQFSSIAIRFKENDYAFFVNGVKIAFDTSAIIFASGVLTKLSFNGSDGGSAFFGKTKELRVYRTALTDAELTTLTTL